MNTNEYLEALERAICHSHKHPDASPEQIYEAMTELCDVLRLGKVEVLLYENEQAEHFGKPEVNSFHDSARSAESFSVSERFVAPDETVVIYRIYPIEGEPEWTEEELGRIRTFIALLSTVGGKSRLFNLVHYLSYHESDLGMYNIKQFMKCARILCTTGQINRFAALRFNLKHFSVVNEYVGRDKGTLVMKMFIGFINDLFDDENELVGRLGGDNFVALIKADKLQPVLNILKGTRVVFDESQNERIFVSATTGVYVIGDDVIRPPDIMERVSLAARIAKTSADTDIVFFNEAILERSKHYVEISANFPKAIEDREFLVYYQPKVAIDGRHVAGAEALCRWMHNGKLVPPGEFIPILEQGRDICKLDFYMLDTVCRDISRWLDSGLNVVRISVNLSRRHLSDPDLLDRVISIIDRNHVPHQYIEIELTETTTDVEFKALKQTIIGLQQAGISTSVDDFGVGYSSLNLIKELPWNVLKLDRSLLPTRDDENPIKKGVMFSYIVSMAQEMGLECISEGVETEEQVQILADNHCNLAQGFYFDRPLPVEEFEKRLDKAYLYV